MTDILLIQPVVGPVDLYVTPYDKLPIDRQTWFKRLTRIPQGLLSTATWLEQHGFSVRVFDARLHLLNGGTPQESLTKDLIREIKQTRLYVGLSVLTMHIPQALRIAELIRSVNPHLPIVWGGVHPTLYRDQTLNDPLVDAVVQGDGEHACLTLAKTGVSHKEYVKTQPFDPNLLKTPRYETLNFPGQDFSKYLIKQSFNPNSEVRGIDYNGSRGCSYGCAFCINSVIPQNRVWRPRSSQKIYADLAYAKEKFNIEYVFFEEEFPFLNPKRSIELARLLKPLNLKFYGNMRADYGVAHYDSLEALRDAGWTETSIGAESGSDRMLDYINKGFRSEEIEHIASFLNDLDIYGLYSFMKDLPTETIDEKLATNRLMARLKRIHPKSEFIGPQVYRPYPGTPWHKESVAKGEFKEPTNLREWVTSGLCDYYAQ